MAYSFRANELRVVLMGRTGSGKSSTGNTLIGSQQFTAKRSPTSTTRVCEVGKSELPDGRTLVVIDTPGFFDTDIPFEKLAPEISKCVSMSSPGPHAFLLILQPERYTPEERESVEKFLKMFGSGVEKYLIVVFTRADTLDGPIEEFIQESDKLKQLMKTCKNRKFAIDNVNKSKRGSQVQQLVALIDNMVGENGGSYYTNEMYEEQTKLLKAQEKELKAKLEREEREKRKAIEKAISDKYEGEITAHKEKEDALRKDISEAEGQLRRLNITMGEKSREAKEARNHVQELMRQKDEDNANYQRLMQKMQEDHKAERKAMMEKMQEQINELRNRPQPQPQIIVKKERGGCSIQ